MKDRLCIFVAVLMFVFRKSRVCFIWRFKDTRRLVTRGFYSFCYYYLRLLSAPTASTIATTPTFPSTSTTSVSFTSFITVSEAIYKSTSFLQNDKRPRDIGSGPLMGGICRSTRSRSTRQWARSFVYEARSDSHT